MKRFIFNAGSPAGRTCYAFSPKGTTCLGSTSVAGVALAGFERPNRQGRRRGIPRQPAPADADEVWLSGAGIRQPVMNERTCAAAHSSQPLRLRPCLLWSAALGRLSKLRTLGLHALPTGAATSSATASEHGHVQAAGQLRRLYFGTVVGEANFWLLGCRLMADSVSSRRSRAVALQKLGGGCRTTTSPTVSFLSPPRTHTGGHQPTVTTGSLRCCCSECSTGCSPG